MYRSQLSILSSQAAFLLAPSAPVAMAMTAAQLSFSIFIIFMCGSASRKPHESRLKLSLRH